MKLFTLTKLGRTLLMLTAVAAVGSVCLPGCGGDDNPSSGNGRGYDVSLSCGDRSCNSALMPDGKTWMTENLNYMTDSSWCYDDSASNCVKYGRLYAWFAAKTACPTGWHLPTRQEWDALITAAGGAVAGKKLKATSGWNGNGNGTDDFGFSALPGGGRFYEDGYYFDDAEFYGGWWTATEYDSDEAWTRYMGGYDDVIGSPDFKSNGFSVRCLKS